MGSGLFLGIRVPILVSTRRRLQDCAQKRRLESLQDDKDLSPAAVLVAGSLSSCEIGCVVCKRSHEIMPACRVIT